MNEFTASEEELVRKYGLVTVREARQKFNWYNDNDGFRADPETGRKVRKNYDLNSICRILVEDRTCAGCSKVFSTMTELTRHLKRIGECLPITESQVEHYAYDSPNVSPGYTHKLCNYKNCHNLLADEITLLCIKHDILLLNLSHPYRPIFGCTYTSDWETFNPAQWSPSARSRALRGKGAMLELPISSSAVDLSAVSHR